MCFIVIAVRRCLSFTRSDSSNAEEGTAGQDPSNVIPDRGAGAPEPQSQELLVLAKFYRYEAAIPPTAVVAASLIHKFNPERPDLDYLLPRQDGEGLITHEATQILKVSKVQSEDGEQDQYSRAEQSGNEIDEQSELDDQIEHESENERQAPEKSHCNFKEGEWQLRTHLIMFFLWYGLNFFGSD
ncbi:hypothetical protein QAD02_013787 [Eretmocerus hayati]|uniref:Uncharacterized protein n=1 Tax=Eretmocerus hayati TaxID=131215 RepID=A0ACC2P8A0_9HYME|nr:hypothetical protein QAD02_013787 [Eretmocerus hayati]